jgi:hypothetical protein
MMALPFGGDGHLVVVRKNNTALRISRIRAIGSDVKSTLRVGRIADVTSADPRGNNVWQLVGSTANGFIAEHRFKMRR